MQTATPAVVPSATIQDFLEAAGVIGVPDHLVVFSGGIYHLQGLHSGKLVPYDTSDFFAAVGAVPGEEITFIGGAIKISRYVVVDTDSST